MSHSAKHEKVNLIIVWKNEMRHETSFIDVIPIRYLKKKSISLIR